jgi:hypothetical protein
MCYIEKKIEKDILVAYTGFCYHNSDNNIILDQYGKGRI